MAIISAIGRTNWKVRTLFGGMYTTLIIGACTMIYPFLLMISGSTKSAMDIKYFDAFPRFLTDEAWMYGKHMEGLFNESVLNLDMVYDTDDVSFERLNQLNVSDIERALGCWRNFVSGKDAMSLGEQEVKKLQRFLRDVRLPTGVDHLDTVTEWGSFLKGSQLSSFRGASPTERLAAAWTAFAGSIHLPQTVPNRDLASAWTRFLDETELPHYSFTSGYINTQLSRTMPAELRRLKSFLSTSIGEDINEVNRQLGTEYLSWNSVYITTPSCLLRREKPSDDDYTKTLSEFMCTTPYGLRYYFSPEGFYKKQFLKVQYTMSIEEYNRTHDTQYGSYSDIHLSRSYPENGTALERQDWESFVRNTLALQWIRLKPAATPAYRDFLLVKHREIHNLNKHYGTNYSSFADIPLIGEPPLTGMVLTDWDAFIAGWQDPETGRICQASASHFLLHSVEYQFQDWLVGKYDDLGELNQQLKTTYQVVADILPPQKDVHWSYFQDNIGSLRWEFVIRNYIAVGEYMLFHGRGIFNTFVYCSLAILSALLINPLAAYAMSRYKMPSSYKILLFLMCTMAFPPMVTAIPNFLMLRQLGLLNTFAALILPGMANGYSIFLLKGFFDAQPQELYESAQLDGASEWVLFWQITMSLSKPILAVIALRAFTMAYSNFMFAFVVCQDEKMWTLMVWLYQLQQRSGQAVMYASLIIAAIPTFLIFLFCQNIIMRGIVVPSEK